VADKRCNFTKERVECTGMWVSCVCVRSVRKAFQTSFSERRDYCKSFSMPSQIERMQRVLSWTFQSTASHCRRIREIGMLTARSIRPHCEQMTSPVVSIFRVPVFEKSVDFSTRIRRQQVLFPQWFSSHSFCILQIRSCGVQHGYCCARVMLTK